MNVCRKGGGIRIRRKTVARRVTAILKPDRQESGVTIQVLDLNRMVKKKPSSQDGGFLFI